MKACLAAGPSAAIAIISSRREASSAAGTIKRLFRLSGTCQDALRTFADRMVPEVVAKGKTLGDAIDRYLLEISPHKAARSFTNDVNNAERLKPVFGDVKLKQQFEVVWAHQYMTTRRTEKGLPAPVQARKEIALLSAIMSQCVEWGWIRRNEMIGQFKRKRTTPRSRDVTSKELAAFKAHAPAWLSIPVAWARPGIPRTELRPAC